MIIVFLKYYEFYFYLFAGGLGAGAAYLSLRARGRKILSVKGKCVTLLGCLLMVSTAAIVMSHCVPVIREGRQEPSFVALGVKMAASVAWGLSCVPLTMCLYDYSGRILHNRKIEKNKYGIAIFVISVIDLIANASPKMDSWLTGWYAADYSMGIGPRFFIGTILRLFYDDYLEQKIVYRFCVVTLVLICAMVSYLLNAVIVRAEERYKGAVIFLVLCFMASPGYISAMWGADCLGRLETYTFLLAMASVFLFSMVKKLSVRYIAVTVLSCISMAIYQGNLFMYYPVILMLTVWDCLRGEDCIKKRLLGGFNLLATGGVFCYFQFFSYTIYENAQEMVAAIEAKSDIGVSGTAIDLELFQPLYTAYDTVFKSFLGKFPRERFVVELILLTPIVILAAAVYLKCRENRIAEREGLLERPYIYFVLLNFAIIPQFMLNMDWGRWMISVTIVLFFGILYLAYQRDKGMVIALEALDRFVGEHRFTAMITIVYLAGLSKFSMKFIAEATAIVSKLFSVSLELL